MLGSLIAVGRTSEVFRWGNDAVAKVLNPEVPDHWAAIEAVLTESVRAVGVPAPEVLDVVAVDGRPAVLFRHIEGPSMWQLMSADPSAMSELFRDFADVQRLIHSAGVPDRFPSMVARVSGKIADVDVVSDEDRRVAIEMVAGLPRGAALLHGDLHPGNILVGASGPVVIDWFDASVGHPAAGLTRTELLIGQNSVTDLQHLPGATNEDLAALSSAYAAEVADAFDAYAEHLDAWRAVTALSRLAERTQDDVNGLVARWNHYRVLALDT